MSLATDIATIDADTAILHSIIHGAAGAPDITTEGGLVPTLAKMLVRVGVGNMRGAWLTATAYALNDGITQAGLVYRCTLAHTAGTFATDLSAGRWVLVSSDPNILQVTATGSTTARGLADRAAEVINVKDFGALGNNIQDDTTFIQAALNAVPAAGGVVFIPAGTYRVTASLIPKAGTTITGQGVASIVATTVVNLHVFTTDDATTRDRLRFERFKITGGGASKHCLNLYMCTNLRVADMVFDDTGALGDGCYLRDCSGVVVERCFCNNTRRQGISLTKGSRVHIRAIDGAGSLLNLIDIEPNAGDAISDVVITDILPGLDTIRAVNVECSAQPMSNLTVDNVRTASIGFGYVNGANISNIDCMCGNVAEEFTSYLVTDASFSNIRIRATTGTHYTKLKISNNTRCRFWNVMIDGGASTDVDALSLVDCVIGNLVIENGTAIGVRHRNSDRVTYQNVRIENGTYGFYLVPTTANTGTRLINIKMGTHSSDGLYLDNNNGDTFLDGDLGTGGYTLGGSYSGNLSISSQVIGLRRETFGTAAPAAGTWARGDLCWNTTPSAAGTPGWVCTTAGTPGTWKAMANLAA